jgi:protein-arginine kinase activator protein McsA
MWYNRGRGRKPNPRRRTEMSTKPQIIKARMIYSICPMCDGEYPNTFFHPIVGVCKECYAEEKEMLDAVISGGKIQEEYFKKEEEKEKLLEEIKKEWRDVGNLLEVYKEEES